MVIKMHHFHAAFLCFHFFVTDTFIALSGFIVLALATAITCHVLWTENQIPCLTKQIAPGLGSNELSVLMHHHVS